MANHRGTGLTELMITNLPAERCTVIVPSRSIGDEIDKRIADTRYLGTWRTIVVANHADVQKMAGLSEPVFFDHSFFDCGTKNPRAIKEAVETAIVSSRMARWKAEAVEPSTDKATAKDQPLVEKPRERVILSSGFYKRMQGYKDAIEKGVMSPDECRRAEGLPPL